MNKKELFEKAENIIDKRRQLAKTQAQDRRVEIYQKLPIIKKYERDLSNDMIDITKLILEKKENSSSMLHRIKEKNLQTQRNIKEELVRNGYPENYLDEDYVCKLCDDTGVYQGERCSCVYDVIKKIATEDFNKTTGIRLCDFSEFNIGYYSNIERTLGDITDREHMTNIYRFCYHYAETFKSNSPSIVMLGNTGLGKTLLSLSIAKKVLEKGYTVVYGSSQDYFTRIQNENFGKIKANESTMDIIKEADLFILDDLGSEYETSFNSSIFYNIINTRLNFDKPIIVNTNLNLQEIRSRYEDRVLSRLMGQCKTLQFVGKDIRQLKNK